MVSVQNAVDTIVEEIDDNLEPQEEFYDADYDFEDEEKSVEQDSKSVRGIVKTGKTIIPPPPIQFEMDADSLDEPSLNSMDKSEELEAFDNFNYCNTPDNLARNEVIAFASGVALTTLIFSTAIAGYFIDKKRKA